MGHDQKTRFARREVVKMIATAAAAPALFSSALQVAVASDAPLPAPGTIAPSRGPAGTLWDPDLINTVVPWELSLDDEQLATLVVLCDVILPADEYSPAASAVGAHEFINEWVSAPFDWQKSDQEKVVTGLAWLDEESRSRFDGRFRDLESGRHHAICDDICDKSTAAIEYADAAEFFDRVRWLTAAAFYTTREGMKDLKYVGNVPLDEWLAPPEEALKHVGLE